jgi:hypothetical protein
MASAVQGDASKVGVPDASWLHNVPCSHTAAVLLHAFAKQHICVQLTSHHQLMQSWCARTSAALCTGFVM